MRSPSEGQHPGAALQAILQRWQKWYRLRRGLGWAAKGLIFGLAFALGLILPLLAWANASGVLSGVLSVSAFTMLVLICVGGGLLVAFGLGLAWPTSDMLVARRFDAWFGLAERTATALEFSAVQAAAQPALTPLLDQQLADTLAVAEQAQPDRKFWLDGWISRTQVALITLLLLAFVGVFISARPVFERAQAQQAVQEIIAQEVEALEVLRQQVAENPKLDPLQKAELDAALQAAQEALEQAQTLEQAGAALTEAQAELQQMNSAQTQQLAQELQQAGQTLSNPETAEPGALQDFAEALSQADFAGAAVALQNLPVEEMSAAELQALAEELAAAAEALQEADPALAEQLEAAAASASAAAQAMQNGDAAAAAAAQTQLRAALSQATAQMLDNAGQIAQANQAQQLSTQVAQANSSLQSSGAQSASIQAGAAQNSAAGSTAVANSGQGQGAGQGSGEGDGSSQNNGSGAGGGAGTGSGGGDAGTGGEAGSDPIAQNNGPGDGGEEDIQLFDPTRLGGPPGAEVTLPPGSGDGETIGQTGSASGSDDPSVIGNLGGGSSSGLTWQANPAQGAPSHLQEMIKRYFSIP